MTSCLSLWPVFFLPKCNHLLIVRIYYNRSKLFPFRVDSHSDGNMNMEELLPLKVYLFTLTLDVEYDSVSP